MTNLETNEPKIINTAAVNELFTHLVQWGLPDANKSALWHDAERLWQLHPELTLHQDNDTIKFKHSDVRYNLGSSAIAIDILVSTTEGNRAVPLRFSGNTPAFSIAPYIEGSPEHLHAPLYENYETLDITQAFNWKEILSSATISHKTNDDPFYLVAFRSKLKPEADTALLAEHDTRAHIAAMESPALIYYFGGTPNEDGEALSFCLWENAEAAKAISRDLRHRDATAMVSAYEHYSIEKYDVLSNGEVVTFIQR